ncbi:MAG TPA: DUF2946 family protein [Bradyrhizobium sp.]|jgi:hypothetical protein|uniref:DUF2946 family protein n=1 Tax=Bradyrhizobium sp. TaxID=376 RepID=UPI002C6EAA06|nr:DUF2946 family protein [Bradyrhizobium sp.]HXB78742.1 DUF2946 family protein [Bradyrhizobium sp.]
MRARLRKYLPVFLIALLVQILAPISASWAAAVAASDPLSVAAICHANGFGADQSGDQGGQYGGHSGCSICCLAGIANTSTDARASVTLAAPYRQPSRVVWQDQTPDLSVFRGGSNAQARAPPFSS